jgi:hypothetical protein
VNSPTNTQQPKPNTYADLVRALLALEPPLFIFGGFAEDVLLNGRVARPHTDVDVLIYRDEIDERLAQFGEFGFTRWEVWWEPRPGQPLVYHATNQGIDLEPSVFERDDRGSFFVLEDAAGIPHRVDLPADAFSHPPIEADGISWRILSPLCLYQIRAAIEILGPFGPLREKDIAAQAVLREHFLADLTEDDLRPRVEPIR